MVFGSCDALDLRDMENTAHGSRGVVCTRCQPLDSVV